MSLYDELNVEAWVEHPANELAIELAQRLNEDELARLQGEYPNLAAALVYRMAAGLEILKELKGGTQSSDLEAYFKAYPQAEAELMIRKAILTDIYGPLEFKIELSGGYEGDDRELILNASFPLGHDPIDEDYDELWALEVEYHERVIAACGELAREHITHNIHTHIDFA